jgi:hypothetical protein
VGKIKDSKNRTGESMEIPPSPFCADGWYDEDMVVGLFLQESGERDCAMRGSGVGQRYASFERQTILWWKTFVRADFVMDNGLAHDRRGGRKILLTMSAIMKTIKTILGFTYIINPAAGK